MTISIDATSAMDDIKKSLDRLRKQARYMSGEERDELGAWLGKMIRQALGNMPPQENAPKRAGTTPPWRHPSEGRRPDIALDDSEAKR